MAEDNKLSIEIPFTGFYESDNKALIDDAISSLFENDRGEIIDMPEGFWGYIDYRKIYEAYSKEYVSAFQEWFNDISGMDDLTSLEFEELVSPRYYNYGTDRIFANISVKDIKTLWRYADKVTLQNTLEKHYTSRSGFNSLYSNDLNDWLKEKPIIEWDYNQLNTLISSILVQEEEENYPAHEVMESALGNGVIEAIVWDNISEKGQALANAWTKKHRPSF